MSGFIIRKANNYDKDLIACTLGAVHAEFKLDFDINRSEADISDIDSYYNSADGEFWVVDSNETICGGIGFKSDKNGNIEVKRLFLSPGWRKLGISRMLNTKAIEFAAKSNTPRLWMIVSGKFSNSLERLNDIGYVNEIAPAGINIDQDSAFLSCKVIRS
ncbi:MAG: GNAT family N-acetyltransferase [Planctomycetota bacterium]|jgi:GNAT superfamily N-acetyltransferase